MELCDAFTFMYRERCALMVSIISLSLFEKGLSKAGRDV